MRYMIQSVFGFYLIRGFQNQTIREFFEEENPENVAKKYFDSFDLKPYEDRLWYVTINGIEVAKITELRSYGETGAVAKNMRLKQRVSDVDDGVYVVIAMIERARCAFGMWVAGVRVPGEQNTRDEKWRLWDSSNPDLRAIFENDELAAEAANRFAYEWVKKRNSDEMEQGITPSKYEIIELEWD